MSEPHAKLNPGFKTKWLDALRSGKYTQTTGRLRKETGYCCLGVACDILGFEWRNENDWKMHEQAWVIDSTNDLYTMPEDIRNSPSVNLDSYTQDCLVEMNDGDSDFLEIADWIEENL